MSHNVNIADRSLLSLSWPILLDLFLHLLTPLINILMVSHLPGDHLAAMAAGNHIFNVCITVFSFISVGCSVVVSQYLGAKQLDEAQKVIHLSVALNFLIGLSIAILLFFFGERGLILVNTPLEILDESFIYLHILGFCLIPEAVSLVLAACLRVYGKTQAVMYVALIANVLTIFGNMIVLYGYFNLPQLGLLGVAWSTLIGRVIAVVLLVILFISQLGIWFRLTLFFNWSYRLLSQVLRIGLPAAGENLLWSLHYITATAFIALLGATAISAQMIYFEIALFLMMFGSAISIANEIQVGYLVGEKAFDKAYKISFSSLRVGVIITIGVVIVFYLFAPQIIMLISNDQEILTMLQPLFLVTLFLEPCRTFNIVMVNSLRASGDANFPLMMALISMWGIAIPLGYLLGIYYQIGIMGFWIAFLCDEFFRGVMHTKRWHSKRWQTKRLNVDFA